MTDRRYVVQLDVQKLGTFAEQMGPAEKKAASLDDRFKSMKQGFATLGGQANAFIGVLDSMVMKAAKVTATFGAIGMGAGIAAATWGVQKLNNELESAQLSIGTIFSVHGFATGVPDGISKASETIEAMRKSAKGLPGEFEDLQRIFLTGAIPAFHSGLDPKQWEKLAAKVMASSKVAQVPLDQAAREFAMLMEGRSGAHNVVGMRLLGLSGDKAEEFNKKSAAERVQLLTTELDKYKGSIDAFATSYDGLSSAFMENVKDFARTASGPLFESVKRAYADANRWFDQHESEVTFWANHVGLKLAAAFEWGRQKIEEWGPLVVDFAGQAYYRFGKFWEEIKPTAVAIGDSLKSALEDPNGTMDKILMAGKLYAGLKIGQAVVGGASAAFSAGTALSGIAGFAGAGGGAAAGGAGAAASLGALAGSAALGAAAIAGLTAGVGLLVYDYTLYKEAERLQAENHAYAAETARGTADSLWDLNWKIGQHAGGVEKATDAIHAYKEMTDTWVADYTAKSHEAFAAGDELTAQSYATAAALLALESAARFESAGVWEHGEKRSNETADYAGQMVGLGIIQQMRDKERSEASAKAKVARHKGGAGGTMKVEITITSNQDPDRIARLAVGRIEDLARRRTVSAFSPYSRTQ